MDIKFLIENLINEFVSRFREESGDNVDINDRIYCNFWKKDMLDALNKHDFEEFPLTGDNLGNWFVRYAHALCEDSKANVRETLKMSNSLGMFPPRTNFIEALKKRSSKVLHKIGDEISLSRGKNMLSADNLTESFQLLLEMEDAEILLDYLGIVQHNVELSRARGPFCYRGKLTQPTSGRSISEIVAAKVDEVVIVPKDLRKPFDTTLVYNCLSLIIPHDNKIVRLPVASVDELSENDVILTPLSRKYNWSNKKVDLIFRPTRFPIRFQYRGLKLLDKNQGMREFLFPEKNINMQRKIELNKNLLEKQKLINKNLSANPEQLAAVSQIVFGRITSQAPFIIFGPPGTGKTTTIVESILQLRLQCPDSRILVTAGSNSACDTIALRICEYFKSSHRLEAYLENAVVLPFLRIYSKSILERGIQHIPWELRRQSNIDWLNGEHAYPAIEDIHRYGIIITTLCTVGKLVCGNVSSEGFFTHVFIDEAGASSEPETIVGIIGIKNDINDNCRIILSGDHKQLGPVIKSDQAVKLGLGKSLMQRLMERKCYAASRNGEYDNTLQIRLRRNYRSHPEIVNIYNKLYYGEELIPMLLQNDTFNWSFLRNSSFPIAFHSVCGEMSKSGTTSSCNMLEVQIVLNYVALLLKADRVKENDIGIITPYKLQSERIKCRLDEQNWNGVEVGSVEYFQGREKRIIIASMVRSRNGLGFVKNRKRLNVLLSRPQALLLILGEPNTLSAFADIRSVIELCKKKGNYYDEKNNTFGKMQTSAEKQTTQKKSSNRNIRRRRAEQNTKKSALKTPSEKTSNITLNNEAKGPQKSNENTLQAVSEKSKNKKSARKYKKENSKKTTTKRAIQTSQKNLSSSKEASNNNANINEFVNMSTRNERSSLSQKILNDITAILMQMNFDK